MQSDTARPPLGNRYDLAARRRSLAPLATRYGRAHEIAHEAQDASSSRIWRLHACCHRMPILNRITLLMVEAQAARVARSYLKATGQWRNPERWEACVGLLSYASRLLLP